MDFPRGDKSPSSEALLPVDTREKIACGKESTDNRQRPVSANKMAYARRTIVVLFLCMLVLLGVASGTGMPCHKAATNQQHEAVKASESSSFSTMLKSASPESLHELLHRFLPDRFKDGVFPSDHQAMEAVHQADAALATSILQLAKRQDSNATDSDDSGTPTPTETSDPPTETSNPPTETSDPPTETTTSTTETPPTTSSTSAEPTSSSSEPPVSSSSTPPSPTSSSSSVPDTTLTTSTVPPTTKPPPSTSKEITTTYTTTSPDGDVVTVTAVTYVPVDPSETAAPESTHSPPTLQNSAIRGYSSGSVLTGAVALAMVLLMV